MAYNPKVDISVRTALSLVPSPGDTISAMIGTAQYGPINEVVLCSSLNDVLNTFQDDRNKYTSITKGAELFFSNGGSALKVVRVAANTAEYSSYAAVGTGVINNAVVFSSNYKGSFGNNIFIDIEQKGTGIVLTLKLGSLTEYYDNQNNTNGYTANQDLVDDVNLNSKIVTAVKNNDALLVPLVNITAFTGGNDGASGVTTTDITDAFDNLLLNEDWSLLMIPNTSQTVSIEDTDMFHSTMVAKVESRANVFNKNGIFVTGVTKDEIIDNIKNRTTKSERFVLTAPSIIHSSRVDGKIEYLDGTYLGCATAGRISSSDATGSAITRKNAGVGDVIVSTSTGKKYYNSVELETLLSYGVCAVSNINGGLKWARGITRISDKTNMYFEINILRIIDELKEVVQSTLDDYLGDPNSTVTRDRMAAVTNGILNQLQTSGKVSEYLPTIVSEGVSPDTVNVSIFVKPIFATNFINVTITVG